LRGGVATLRPEHQGFSVEAFDSDLLFFLTRFLTSDFNLRPEARDTTRDA
jgi:hypothetical protein